MTEPPVRILEVRIPLDADPEPYIKQVVAAYDSGCEDVLNNLQKSVVEVIPAGATRHALQRLLHEVELDLRKAQRER
jgi:hypothetical protein